MAKTPGTRQALAEHADRIARALERDAVSTLRPVLRAPRTYGELVVEMDDSGIPREQFSDRIQAAVTKPEWAMLSMLSEAAHTTPGEDLIQMVRWANNRIVYAVDPDAATAVINTDWGTTVIPGDVLRRLPHPDPLVILPEPVMWLNTDGVIERYEAFGVFGVRSGRRRCSTHHPDVTHYVMHFFGHLAHPETPNIPMEVMFTSYAGEAITVKPIVGMRAIVALEDATMTEREDLAIRDMWNAGPTAVLGFADATEAEQGMAQLTRIGLALLTYLVSDNADTTHARTVTLSKKDRKRNPHPVEPTRVIEVGYRIGAALRDHHQHETRRHAGMTGRTVAPHIRRAHLHTFRRGPGKTERFVKWLPPIPIAADKHGSDVNTIYVR